MEDPTAPAELTSQDYRQRLWAIYRLVEQHPRHAGAWIRPLLKDRESLVRSAAIVALGEIQDQDSFDELVACLTAPTSLERRSTVLALMALGEEQMRSPLVQALSHETNASVCRVLIKGLSTFATDSRVIDILIQELWAPDEDVRAAAAVALAKMQASAALPALQHMLETDTNQETIIHDQYVVNSHVAQMAIAAILSGQLPAELDWPY